MRCPYCSDSESRVIDTRDVDATVRRRRECLRCGLRFTTFERVELAGLQVVKRDGRREDFDRRKLAAGIRKACEKRPLPAGSVESMVDELESELHKLGKAEVHSQVIGERAMESLRRLDEIAYIRFASAYRPFRDLDSLRQELEALATRREHRRQSNGQLPLFSSDQAPIDTSSESSRRSRIV